MLSKKYQKITLILKKYAIIGNLFQNTLRYCQDFNAVLLKPFDKNIFCQQLISGPSLLIDSFVLLTHSFKMQNLIEY